jgi:hypothetical protein
MILSAHPDRLLTLYVPSRPQFSTVVAFSFGAVVFANHRTILTLSKKSFARTSELFAEPPHGSLVPSPSIPCAKHLPVPAIRILWIA